MHDQGQVIHPPNHEQVWRTTAIEQLDANRINKLLPTQSHCCNPNMAGQQIYLIHHQTGIRAANPQYQFSF